MKSLWIVVILLMADKRVFIVTDAETTMGPICEGDPCARPKYCVDEYRLPNPDNCTTFYFCVHSEWLLRDCAEGTAFNPDACECEYIEDLECAVPCPTTTPGPTLPPDTCHDVPEPCESGKKYPDQSDCGYFYPCVDGQFGNRTRCTLDHGRCDTPGYPCVFDVYSADCLHPYPGYNCDYRCLTTANYETTAAFTRKSTTRSDGGGDVTSAAIPEVTLPHQTSGAPGTEQPKPTQTTVSKPYVTTTTGGHVTKENGTGDVTTVKSPTPASTRSTENVTKVTQEKTTPDVTTEPTVTPGSTGGLQAGHIVLIALGGCAFLLVLLFILLTLLRKRKEEKPKPPLPTHQQSKGTKGTTQQSKGTKGTNQQSKGTKGTNQQSKGTKQGTNQQSRGTKQGTNPQSKGTKQGTTQGTKQGTNKDTNKNKNNNNAPSTDKNTDIEASFSQENIDLEELSVSEAETLYHRSKGRLWRRDPSLTSLDDLRDDQSDRNSDIYMTHDHRRSRDSDIHSTISTMRFNPLYEDIL